MTPSVDQQRIVEQVGSNNGNLIQKKNGYREHSTFAYLFRCFEDTQSDYNSE